MSQSLLGQDSFILSFSVMELLYGDSCRPLSEERVRFVVSRNANTVYFSCVLNIMLENQF